MANKFLLSFNFLTTDQQYPIDYTFQNLKVKNRVTGRGLHVKLEAWNSSSLSLNHLIISKFFSFLWQKEFHHWLLMLIRDWLAEMECSCRCCCLTQKLSILSLSLISFWSCSSLTKDKIENETKKCFQLKKVSIDE